MKKRNLLFLVSFSLLAALIYFSNPSKVFTIITNAKIEYIFLGLSFWLITAVMRSLRWRYLLGKLDVRISFPGALKYYITGLFISNLSPAKSADPIRAVFLKKMEGESFSKGMASISLERILDLLAMITIAIPGLVLLTLSSNVVVWAWGAIGLYIFMISFFFYLLFSGDKLEKFLGKFVSIFSFIPQIKRLGNKVEKFSGKLRESMRRYSSKRTLATAFLWSLAVWILNFVPVWMAFYALGFEVPFTVVVTVLTLATLIGIITFLPGTLGSGEVLSVTMFSMLLTISVSGLTSAVILGRFLNFWVYAFVGAVLITTFPEDALDFGERK